MNLLGLTKMINFVKKAIRDKNNAYNREEGWNVPSLYFLGTFMKKENSVQADIVKELQLMFPQSIIFVNDGNYIQGFPDITILGDNNRWACLEVKKSLHEPYQPNQEYYIALINKMSFCRMICPENKSEVYRELQQSLKPKRKSRIIES